MEVRVIDLQIQKRICDTFAIHLNTAGNRLSTNCLDIFITHYYCVFHYVTKIRHQATRMIYFPDVSIFVQITSCEHNLQWQDYRDCNSICFTIKAKYGFKNSSRSYINIFTAQIYLIHNCQIIARP